MERATDCADWMIATATRRSGGIHASSLHNLLYLAHGWTLASLKRPLFPETIEAWSTMPIAPKVFQHLKGRGSYLTAGPEAPLPQIDNMSAYLLGWTLETYHFDNMWRARAVVLDEKGAYKQTLRHRGQFSWIHNKDLQLTFEALQDSIEKKAARRVDDEPLEIDF